MYFFLKFVLVVFASVQFANLCTTIYLHRGLAHRALTFSKPMEFFLRFFLWLTTTITRQEWVAVHRKHHAFTDQEDDPHSPLVKGFWNIQLWNYFYYRREANNPEVIQTYSADIPPDAFDRLSRFWWLPMLLLLGIFIAVLGPIWGLIALPTHFLSYVVLNSTINGAGHWFGYRHHDNSGTNIWTVALITAGEGFHNNHHNKPASAKLMNRWWEIDLGWYAIYLFSVLRLVKVR